MEKPLAKVVKSRESGDNLKMVRRCAAGQSLNIVLWLVFSISMTGCVYFVLGGVAAVGGYAVSPDTIQGETEKDYDEVWEAAVDVATIMGKVDYKSDKIGEISAIINGARIRIDISQLSPSMVRIKVKARKSFFPSISVAQDVYVKIMRRLDEDL